MHVYDDDGVCEGVSVSAGVGVTADVVLCVCAGVGVTAGVDVTADVVLCVDAGVDVTAEVELGVHELDGVCVADDDGVAVLELEGVAVDDDDGVVVGVVVIVVHGAPVHASDARITNTPLRHPAPGSVARVLFCGVGQHSAKLSVHELAAVP